MKKAKAIELLKLAVPIKALTQQEYSDFVKAVNMGMDALAQPTSPDTIDRKAALDALRKCQTYLYDARDPELKIELSSAEAAIKELPTIQPVATDTNVGDTISRQAAIDAINHICPIDTDCDGTLLDRVDVRYVLSDLPSAQPETAKRIVGKSRDGMTLWYQCDMCYEPVDEQDNYCRGCGRRLIDG